MSASKYGCPTVKWMHAAVSVIDWFCLDADK